MSHFTLGHALTLSGFALARTTLAQALRATKFREEPKNSPPPTVQPPQPKWNRSRSDVPDWVEKLYQRMLAKNSAQRPQFMGDLVAQLERPISRSGWQKLLAALGWSSED